MDAGPDTKHEDAISVIKLRIAELVDGCFSRGEQTVHLSWLGNKLGPDRVLLEQLSGAKLAQYIKANFDYAVIYSGEHKNIIQLAPPGTDTAPLTNQSHLYQPPTEARPPRPAAIAPRYVPALWAAFAKPLEPGQAGRFINLTTMTFGPDRPALEVNPNDDICHIEPEFIATPEASGNASETAQRLQRWIERQKLDSRDYVVGCKRASSSKRHSPLSILIDALTADQLKRAVLPLDVVKALLEHKA